MARIGTIILVLAVPLILHAQEDLPPGATARLGSDRFRHAGWITAIAYSPDGKWIATGCIDGHLRMWEATSGHLAWKSPVGAMVTSLDFSPDGTLVAAGGFRGWGGGSADFVVFVASSGRAARTFSMSAYGIRSLAFSPDGKRLAVGTGVPASPGLQVLPDEASFVQILDLKTRDIDRKRPGHSRAVTSLAYSPDGKALATAGPEEDLRITDLASGKTLHEIEQGGHSIAYFPDGKLLAAGSRSGLIRILDPATGKIVREVSADEEGLRSIAFSADGRMLAATVPGVQVPVWDTTSWDRIRTIRLPARSRLPSSWDGLAYPLAFSPDGKTLAVGSHDHLPHFIDIATGKDRSDPGGHRAFVADLAFSPDGRILASSGGNGSVLLWDTSGHDLVRAIETGDPPHHAIAFSPDGMIVAAGGQGDSIRVFRVHDGEPLRSWSLRKATRKEASVQGIRYSLDGKRLYASTADGWLYGLDTGGDDMEVLAHPTPQDRMNFRFRRRGSSLLEVGPWTQAYLETLAQGPGGEILHRASSTSVRSPAAPGMGIRTEEMGLVSTLAILPDGGGLVAGGQTGGIRLWEMATQEMVLSSGTGGGGPVTSLAVSPDGSHLAWAGVVRSIFLLHFGRGLMPIEIPEAGAGILTLAFSPDGKILASAGVDGAITLWDMDLVACPTRPFYEDVDEEALERIWKDLALGDAKLADTSMWALAHSPDDSLPFLEKRLRPAPEIGPERFQTLLEDLDHDAFAVREKATGELIALGPAVEDDLIIALDSRVSPEVQTRLERILSRIRPPFRQFPSEVLRRIRTIRTLERMGTPEAASLLRSYSERSRSDREKRQIEAALRRMGVPREF